MKISEFKEAHSALDMDAFVAKYKHPFLLLSDDVSSDEPFNQPFETIGVDMMSLRGAVFGKREPDIWPIIRNKDSSSLMVTLGRSSNSDIFLDHAVISKLHAIFRWDEYTGVCTITDPGSRNGTTLNGRPLPVKQPVSMMSGDVIRLARRFRGTYLSSADVYSLLVSS